MFPVGMVWILFVVWSLLTLVRTRKFITCKDSACQNKTCKKDFLRKNDCIKQKVPEYFGADQLKFTLSVSFHKRRLLKFKWRRLKGKYLKTQRQGSAKVYVLMLLFYDSHGEEVTQSRRCYVVDVDSRRRQQIQGSLTCQMYRQFHRDVNVTAVLYVKQDRTRRETLGVTSLLYKHPGSSQVSTAETTTAASIRSCSSWKPENFHAEPDFQRRSVTVNWKTLNTDINVEVGLMSVDNPDSFHCLQQLFMDVSSLSVTFQNISDGNYRAMIRPSGCMDCDYGEYYDQPCEVSYTSTDTFTFTVQHEQTSRVKPVVEVQTRKNTNSGLLLWLLLGVSLSFCLLISCVIYRYKNNQHKQIAGWKRNFSRTQRVVLVYCSDCEEHLEAVLQLVKLLKKMVSEVIYPDDPNLLSAVKENTVLWADNQARCDYNTVFVIIYSQLLHQLYKAMSADENTFRIISNNNPDPFKDIAPHLLQNLKTKHNVILVNLGYRQTSPASALHSISCKHFVLTKGSSSAGSRKRQMTIEELLTWFGVSGGKISFVNSEEEKCFCESVDRVHQFMENNPQWFEHTFLNP